MIGHPQRRCMTAAGGRAKDRDELVAEYDLSEEEADAICEDLRRMDEKED